MVVVISITESMLINELNLICLKIIGYNYFSIE